MAGNASFRQFSYLMWKNWLIRKRHFIATGFEILLPILMCILLVSLRTLLPSSTETMKYMGGEQVIPANQLPPWDPLDTNPTCYYGRWNNITIYYFPSSGYASELMKKTMEFLKDEKFHHDVMPLSSEDELDVKSVNTTDSFLAVIFDNIGPDTASPPSKLKYRIRSRDTKSVSNRYPIFKPSGPNRDDGGYACSGFLQLQAAVDRSHTKLLAGNRLTDSVKVLLQPFPYPEYISNDSIGTLFSLVPMLLVFSLVVMSPIIVLRVVQEKNNRAKEMMRLMGMSDFQYWLSVFVNNFILIMVICIIMTILFKVPFSKDAAVLDYADGSVFFFLMLLYSASFIAFSMALTPFFNKPALAVIFDIIIFIFLTYIIPVIIVDPVGSQSNSVRFSAKLASCLLPNMALHWGCKVIASYESIGVSATWSNLFSSPIPDDKMALGYIILVLIASIPMYLIILWYVDAVWPWQDGVPKPFYFPFQYWLKKEKSALPHEDDIVLEPGKKKHSCFEEAAPDLIPGVSIRNLTKVFGRGGSAKVAVNNISLDIYKNQITALLGHNGAGKTTTMNMVTGMFTPTSGTVQVNGYDILKETKEARKNLGLCPQHNVIYNEMTVSEHLTFFAGLKGCPKEKIDAEVQETLRMLQLENKKNELARNLSGGMKRKLCLGIAYIGGSEVLILDEPTSGMDPQARRAVWDLLQGIRRERTILLTTHFMEEADVLGDRIAIMAEGEVKCSGSTMFLKHKFGTGYQLRVAKGSKDCSTAQVTSLIQKHLPEATLESDEAMELLYGLGGGSSDHFPALFKDLEEHKTELGISTFGVSITTMEDVFLKVGHMADVDTADTASNDAASSAGESLLSPALPVSPPLTGFARVAQQLKGLFLKRAHYAKRHWSILFFQVLIPFIVWILLLVLTSEREEGGLFSSKSSLLDLEGLFGSTVGFYIAGGNKSARDNYVPLLRSKTTEVKEVHNATAFILGIAEKDMQDYRRDYITGGEFSADGRSAISWYNTEPLHTTPIALNLIDTALLRMATGDASAGFEVSSHPLPSRYESLLINTLKYKVIYANLVPLALAFLSSSFVMFPIHERVSKAKLLQLMSGLSSFVFWGASFLWDFAVHIILCSVLMILILPCDGAYIFLSSSRNMGALFILLVLYGWCSIPFAYLVSFMFTRTAVGFCVFLLFNLLLGMIIGSTMAALEPVLTIFAPKDFNTALNIVRLLPTFSVTWGIATIQSLGRTLSDCNSIKPAILDAFCVSREIAMKKNILPCCTGICVDEECAANRNPFSTSISGNGGDMIFLFVMGIVLFLLLNLLDANYMRLWYILRAALNRQRSVASAVTMTVYPSAGEDSDVVAERQRVEDLFVRDRVGEEAMIVLNLSKTFKSVVAVDRLTFGVHKEECFGLLGVNGAGKTTTFRMLTGDLMLSDGNAYINKYDLKSGLKKFQTYVGYCPQFDPLLDRLTGREMLYLFARLRGVEESNIKVIVNHLIKMVDLEKHADKVTENYSGGNRRKLSLAMALIGSPPIVFLDEPTSGVDPAARRKIWSTLTEAQNVFHMSVVLTSHSMEECEALCSRLAIMVNGQFCCIGGVQHLRAKFGQGYTVIAKLQKAKSVDPSALNQVKNFIESQFPSASLKDAHQGLMQYHITDTSIPWSHLFTQMEEAKKRFELEDYVVSDTTLEQIFLMFARSQRITAQNTMN